MDWIDSVLTGTDHVETPKNFVRWSLFSAIAAVTSPNVSLNKQGAYDLYPNVYVMLLAESGVGKGFGVWLAKSLVTTVDNTRVFAGRNSIQKIVTDLSMAITKGKGKEMIKDARAYLSSGEFVNFLLRDEQAISILTEWYDTHYVKEWANSLKSSGTETLKDINVTLLGASTADYLRESVPVAAIRGGFFGRLMLVYSAEKGKVNALIDEGKEEEQVQPKVKEWAKYLKELSKIEAGSKFKVTDRAKEYYRPWYYDLQERIRTHRLVDKTGYIHRLHDHALKLAMILSLSQSTELVLERCHVEEGIELANDLLATVKKTVIGIGLSQMAPKNEVFLRSLFRADENRMLRRKMMQDNHNEFDSVEMDRVALTLEDAGFIKSQGQGPNAEYLLTALGKKQFLDIQQELKRKQR
jgi:hypothetical protein